MTLIFTVNNQTLLLSKTQQNLGLVADSKKYLITQFNFQSNEWRENLVYALFSHNGKTYKQILGADSELKQNECWVPSEVIKSPNFKVSLVCGDRITTNEVTLKIHPSGYTEKIENQDTTPSVIEQMEQLMHKYAVLCNDIYKECQKIYQQEGDK